MATFEDTFKDLLARYLRSMYSRLDVAEVVSYEQESRSGGYCDTCAYTDIVVEVCYRTSEGDVLTHDIYGSMASLVEDLSAFDREETPA